LLVNFLVNLILPYLQWSPKPKKLVFYLLYILPETTAFLCYCIFFYPDTVINMRVVEMIRFGDEMQVMLKVHHLAAIVFGVGAGWATISTENVLLAQYILWTGALGVIHAVIDCVPHIYLTLRQFKAPSCVTNVFGFLSAWPLTLFRMGNNILYVFVVRYFCVSVLDEFSTLFYIWTVFSIVIFLVLAVTQVWAHGIYVAIMKKDRKEAKEKQEAMGVITAA
ncbi:hypothetical protein HDU99_001492, partial [Rhizoclosmatium hyalinum]